MVHYIRLLSCPRVEIDEKAQPVVYTVAAVTTDLGDDFLWAEIPLLFRVLDATDVSVVIARTILKWQPHSRVIKLQLLCPKPFRDRLCRLHVALEERSSSSQMDLPPKVLDVWSAQFFLRQGAQTDPLVERQFFLSPSLTVNVWEETGDSIARHVWYGDRLGIDLANNEYRDAALACLVLLQGILRGSHSSKTLSGLFTVHGKTKLSVLELGAGCGLVGIGLATVFPQTEIVLTDLPDAAQLVLLNIKQAKKARMSSLQWGVLDWSHPPQKTDLPRNIDLVVIADCIYNTNSIPSLVQTIAYLLHHNSGARFLVARKPRHDSEELFFELAANLPLKLLESWSVALPHVMNTQSADPVVEFHLYGRS